MPKYTQAGRPLRIHTPLGDDQLFLLGLEGDEGVSTLFHFKLRLVRQLEGTTTNDQPIPFGDLLGKSVTIDLVSLETTRTINGIVSLLSEGDSHPPYWLPLTILGGAVYQTGAVVALGRDFLSRTRLVYDGPKRQARLHW